MAKKQTRRSVSIRGSTYELIRKHCEQNDLSMSLFVEERIAEFFGNGLPAKPKPKAKSKAKSKKAKDESRLSADEMQDAARIFTF